MRRSYNGSMPTIQSVAMVRFHSARSELMNAKWMQEWLRWQRMQSVENEFSAGAIMNDSMHAWEQIDNKLWFDNWMDGGANGEQPHSKCGERNSLRGSTPRPSAIIHMSMNAW